MFPIANTVPETPSDKTGNDADNGTGVRGGDVGVGDWPWWKEPMPVIGTEVDGLQMEWRLLMFGPVFSSFDAVGTELAPTVSSVAQSYLTFCDPMDCSLPDASFLGFSRQKYWSGLIGLPSSRSVSSTW